MTPSRNGRWPRAVAGTCAALVLLAACSSDSDRPLGLGRERDDDRRAERRSGAGRPSEDPARRGPTTSIPPRSLAPGYLLASGFDYPLCGFWWRPKPGCEFGVEGVDTTSGSYEGRSGDSVLRLERMSLEHMGVVTDVPLPGGHGFVGVASRIPAFPQGAISESEESHGHIQLLQLSPTDGRLPAMPVEVRLFADRRLGIGLFKDKNETAMSDWRVPVDEWFYIVVELNNGAPAPQRLWIYDSDDRLVDKVVTSLHTQQVWSHQRRTAHKVGGSTTTLTSMYTYHDDWYIATEFKGPVRISPTGSPLDQ